MINILGFSEVSLSRCLSSLKNFKHIHDKSAKQYNRITKELKSERVYYFFGLLYKTRFEIVSDKWSSICKIYSRYSREFPAEEIQEIQIQTLDTSNENIYKDLKNLADNTDTDYVLCSQDACKFISQFVPTSPELPISSMDVIKARQLKAKSKLKTTY